MSAIWWFALGSAWGQATLIVVPWIIRRIRRRLVRDVLTATGDDLDRLAELFGTERIVEPDNLLRRRIHDMHTMPLDHRA